MQQEPDVVLSTDAPQTGPKLPQRILGNNLRIDVKLGGGYRGWVPQQYPHVDVHAGSYYVWNIELKAKLFRFLNLRRGFYESNGLSGPRTDEAAVAAQVGSYVPKAAWLLGVVGFPLFKIWEPVIRYESRAYHTEAERSRFARDRDVVEMLSACEPASSAANVLRLRDAGSACGTTRAKIPGVLATVRELPPLMVGIGLMQYRMVQVRSTRARSTSSCSMDASAGAGLGVRHGARRRSAPAFT